MVGDPVVVLDALPAVPPADGLEASTLTCPCSLEAVRCAARAASASVGIDLTNVTAIPGFDCGVCGMTPPPPEASGWPR